MTSLSPAPSIIYQAERKTAARRGEVLEQAIIVEMRYNPALTPKLSFQAATSPEVMAIPAAQMCSPKTS